MSTIETPKQSAVELTGRSIIGFSSGKPGGTSFRAFDPQTGKACEPAFTSASLQEVDRAVELAVAAAPEWAKSSGRVRAEFLRAIASGLEKIADAIIERAQLETGLPVGRFKSELARTCGQVRLFADV